MIVPELYRQNRVRFRTRERFTSNSREPGLCRRNALISAVIVILFDQEREHAGVRHYAVCAAR